MALEAFELVLVDQEELEELPVVEASVMAFVEDLPVEAFAMAFVEDLLVEEFAMASVEDLFEEECQNPMAPVARLVHMA